MKKLVIIILIILISVASYAGSDSENIDTIILKNGQILTGTITESNDETITLQTEFGVLVIKKLYITSISGSELDSITDSVDTLTGNILIQDNITGNNLNVDSQLFQAADGLINSGKIDLSDLNTLSLQDINILKEYDISKAELSELKKLQSLEDYDQISLEKLVALQQLGIDPADIDFDDPNFDLNSLGIEKEDLLNKASELNIDLEKVGINPSNLRIQDKILFDGKSIINIEDGVSNISDNLEIRISDEINQVIGYDINEETKNVIDENFTNINDDLNEIIEDPTKIYSNNSDNNSVPNVDIEAEIINNSNGSNCPCNKGSVSNSNCPDFEEIPPIEEQYPDLNSSDNYNDNTYNDDDEYYDNNYEDTSKKKEKLTWALGARFSSLFTFQDYMSNVMLGGGVSLKLFKRSSIWSLEFGFDGLGGVDGNDSSMGLVSATFNFRTPGDFISFYCGAGINLSFGSTEYSSYSYWYNYYSYTEEWLAVGVHYQLGMEIYFGDSISMDVNYKHYILRIDEELFPGTLNMTINWLI